MKRKQDNNKKNWDLLSISDTCNYCMRVCHCVCSSVEGAGVELIDLICLALCVLRRLLQLSPQGQLSSAMVSSLSARPAGHSERHFVTIVAQYIYHRHNPQLPSLATKLLTTLSVVSIRWKLATVIHHCITVQICGVVMSSCHNRHCLCLALIGLSSVLHPRQHSIGYMGDSFYRLKDPTDSI